MVESAFPIGSNNGYSLDRGTLSDDDDFGIGRPCQ